ncbi:DUF2971 domain-containing protein [Leeuwenhoekiella sp. A16]|uniref:DUF2971 domain-containing protein n=1 Tax=Leeuwenhoekiella sp. A16 TaxID=3141462 RepID=UPI003A7FC46E
MKPKDLELDHVTFINNGQKLETKLNKDKPKKLYKYYSLNSYSIEGLVNSTIYFSHVYLLNDIVDGELNLLWDFQNFLKNNKDDLKKIIPIPSESNEDRYIERYIKNRTIPEFLESRGVLSLTSSYNNELLWTHYCNEKGFCLEIEISKFEEYLKKIKGNENYQFFPVSYYSPLKQIDFDKYALITKEIGDFGAGLVERNSIDAKLPILYGLASKEKHWEYEEEWRVLLNDAKFNSITHPLQIINDYQKEVENDLKLAGNIKIERDVIGKIILGPLFFNNERFTEKIELANSFIYIFKKNKEGELARFFLITLEKNFHDKIYRVDKILKNKAITREITHVIKIIGIGNNYVKLSFLSINSDSKIREL